ncbi:uncharacterized protein [Diabrotica undecimpunctata]|uniref:uncharacterized protein isoform X2 n=1 Tax=Diabrotica undecimpunctata TaxID=50387 RepID=UPI003B64066F
MKLKTYLAVVLLVSTINFCKAGNTTEVTTGPLAIIEGVINGIRKVPALILDDIVKFVERIVETFTNTFNLTDIHLFPTTEQLTIIGNTLVTLEGQYFAFLNRTLEPVIDFVKRLPALPTIPKLPEFPTSGQTLNFIVTLVSLYLDFLQTFCQNLLVKMPALPPLPNIEALLQFKTIFDISAVQVI